jgi:SRSO17 transposase
MSLLDYPESQALLNDADVIFPTVKDCADRLIKFFPRYLPKFHHVEQRAKPTLVIRGLISGLECKSREPIAIQAGLPRKPIPFFVGAGKWDNEAVMAALHDLEESSFSGNGKKHPTPALKR